MSGDMDVVARLTKAPLFGKVRVVVKDTGGNVYLDKYLGAIPVRFKVYAGIPYKVTATHILSYGAHVRPCIRCKTVLGGLLWRVEFENFCLGVG